MKNNFLILLCFLSFNVLANTVGYRGEILYFTANPAKEMNATVYYRNGYLIIKDGYVVKSGRYASLKDYPVDKVVDYSGKIITPGFVDTHVHYPQLTMIGEYGEQLIGWLNTYTFPTEISRSGKLFANLQYWVT